MVLRLGLLIVLFFFGEWSVGAAYPQEPLVTWSPGQADPLVKRGYILHNVENGNPRYTTLVRRNFLRFGKRGDPTPPEQNSVSQWPFADKRTRNFIRFGKRDFAEDSGEQNEDSDPMARPEVVGGDPHEKIRRVSNFLRFGKRDVGESDEYVKCTDYLPGYLCGEDSLQARPEKKMKQFLRFGR